MLPLPSGPQADGLIPSQYRTHSTGHLEQRKSNYLAGVQIEQQGSNTNDLVPQMGDRLLLPPALAGPVIEQPCQCTVGEEEGGQCGDRALHSAYKPPHPSEWCGPRASLGRGHQITTWHRLTTSCDMVNPTSSIARPENVPYTCGSGQSNLQPVTFELVVATQGRVESEFLWFRVRQRNLSVQSMDFPLISLPQVSNTGHEGWAGQTENALLCRQGW